MQATNHICHPILEEAIAIVACFCGGLTSKYGKATGISYVRSNSDSGNIDSFYLQRPCQIFSFSPFFCGATEVKLINTHIYKHKYIYIYIGHSKVGDDGLSFLPNVISVSISITTIYSSVVEFSFRRGGRLCGGAASGRFVHYRTR